MVSAPLWIALRIFLFGIPGVAGKGNARTVFNLIGHTQVLEFKPPRKLYAAW